MQKSSQTKKYCYDYPRPAVTVDVVCFLPTADTLKVLLIRRGREPYKDSWALPGGFVNMDEDLESSAKRELQEETGLEVKTMEQFYTFGDPGRDPRGRTISVAFLAWLDGNQAKGSEKIHGGDDAAEAEWFNMEKLPKLAFDHSRIIEKAKTALVEWQKLGRIQVHK